MVTKKLLVSITGRTKKDWQKKLREINQYRVKEVGLFLEMLNTRERQGIFPALKNSCIKEIPLVHIRTDTSKQDIAWLKKNFSVKYFTMHEEHFHILNKWRGYYKNLYLEMNTDDHIDKYVKVEKIGGFCIDLAHFKREVTDQDKEYRYIVEKIGKARIACNHVSGYNYNRNKDLHTVKSIRDFDYLFTLPHNLFGQVMAFEHFTNIKKQLQYKKLLKKSIPKKLGFKIT